MLSKTPIDLKLVKQENIDKEILRLGIIAELDAVSLYEQMAALTQNEQVREVLLDVAKEEKTHIGEFQALLLRLDPEYAPELVAGKKEVMGKEASMNPRKAFEQVLAKQAAECPDCNRRVAVERKQIVINWNDPKSIKKAERAKTVLENSGYSLVQTEGGFSTSILIYER